ncbi:MAG TPA: alpha/beta hydrolase [Gemmataceae bacterium]|nr:alpha/beta hydrolase [Gemmataceae bacterium]
MQATLDWFSESGAEFSPGVGRSGLAHLKHYTARYCVWGEGQPLVLVPGLAGGFELLGPLARLLSEHFQVISYQLRGEDDCFALRQRFELPDLVEDLHEFLDWFGLERPPILGVSFGGVLALELAMRWPHRVQSLMTQGVGARFERGLLQQVAGWVLSRYPLPSDSPFVNQFFNLLFGTRQRPGPLFEFVTRQCWQTDQSVMTHRFQLVESFDPGPRLHSVRVPTLLMAGDRDLLASPQSLGDLVRDIKDARRVDLPRCGHLAFVTQPERVAAEVQHFLRKDERPA